MSASGPVAANDVGHLVLGELTVSAAAAVTMLGSSAVMSSLATAIARGEPTPWMGLLERVMLGAWLAWMAVLALRLLRPDRSALNAQPR